MPADQHDKKSLPSILVVDDDEISLDLLTMMLDAEGYTVRRAGGGEEAIKIAADSLENGEPSLVLADLQMPGLCGRELALAMRTLLPRALMIAMSATPATPDEAEAYDAFLGKPLDFEALRNLALQRQLNIPAALVDIYAADDEDIPVLDDRVYVKLQRMMSPAALAEVYAVCLRDSRQRALRMQEFAIEEEAGIAAVRSSAHAIKGGAGMVGASRLAHAAARLELGSYRKDDLPVLVNKLLFSCDQLQSILFTKSKQAV